MDYGLAAFTGIRLPDDIDLLLAPGCIITQVRKLPQQSSAILRWELLAIIGGVFLPFASQEQSCQWLWIVTAEGMIGPGAFL